jgi:hypothetical protein
MLRFLGLFIPGLKEFPEMMYQFDQDYFFDSTKFEQKFGMDGHFAPGWHQTPVSAIKTFAMKNKTLKSTLLSFVAFSCG